VDAEAADLRLLERAGERRRRDRQRVERGAVVEDRQHGPSVPESELDADLAGRATIRVVHDVGHQLDDAQVDRVDARMGKTGLLGQRARPRAHLAGGAGAALEREAVPLEGLGGHAGF
jgi:hypothetical protein